MSGVLVLLGVLVGAGLTALAYGVKSKGTLILDNSDPEASYLFVELTKSDVGSLMTQKYVVFRVAKRN